MKKYILINIVIFAIISCSSPSENIPVENDLEKKNRANATNWFQRYGNK